MRSTIFSPSTVTAIQHGLVVDNSTAIRSVGSLAAALDAGDSAGRAGAVGDSGMDLTFAGSSGGGLTAASRPAIPK